MFFSTLLDEAALGELPDDLEGARVDVADPGAVGAWLEPIASAGIDIMVNNAGVAGPTKPVERITPDEWRRCLAVGLDGQFHCTRHVVPTMKAHRHGAIINIASTAGVMGMPYRAPYVAAKFAVVGFTKTLAMELGRYNIRVNAIAPGAISGDRMDRVVRRSRPAGGYASRHFPGRSVPLPLDECSVPFGVLMQSVGRERSPNELEGHGGRG